jgi:hypothetical protein
MGEYPPKLMQVATTAFGSLLTLSDGREVPINISPDCLSRALVANERPPLSELLANRSLDVFAGMWETTAEEWQRIGDLVRASPVAAAALGEAPSVGEVFGQPVAFVHELPQRVYGGLEQALYTSHPFEFRRDPNRPAPWYRGLLSATGGRLFNIWVHLAGGEVEVEMGVRMGHFLE